MSVQYLLMWRRRRDTRTALWLGMWSATLAVAMLTNVFVFRSSPAQEGVALLARTVAMCIAGVLVIPTAAMFAGRPIPRIGVAAVLLIGAGRIALFATTNLIFTHHIAPDGVPVYGPLLAVTTVPFIALVLALLVRLALSWEDAVERSLFGLGIAAGAAIIAESFLTQNLAVGELLVGYWIIPSVLALQAVSIRRMSLAETAERALEAQEIAVAAELSRTERRSRLALQSGGMGWYEFNPASGGFTTSVELRGILGIEAGGGRGTIAAMLEYVHAEDRPAIVKAVREAGQTASAHLEFRWLRPDGRTLWIETDARVVDGSDGSPEIVGVVKDITPRKRSEAELRHEARHDQLTGLANRAELLGAMEAALGRPEVFSLLLIDLDGFKDVNDTLGHPVGDGVLVAVTKRFAGTIRGGDLLARLGGDEFAIMVADSVEAAGHVAGHLLNSLADPVEVDGVTIRVRASIGVVEAHTHGDNAHILLQRADAAMYRAKVQGGSWHLFTDSDDQTTSRRLQLAAQLPSAIENGQIQVHYQPTIEITSGRCAQLEALVRWRHPKHGLIPPLEFVPLAEQYGLGLPLFRHVLDRSLRQVVQWRDAGLTDAVAVNVTPQTLVSEGFAGHVATALAAAGAPGSALVIEVTENAFAGETPELLKGLAELRALGVSLAIDDFGTGYSSLSYLQLLPVDTVKLDRAFTAELGLGGVNDEIVKMTVSLAHRLELAVVAEGVETGAVLDALSRHGCDTAQGYWICRPGPAGEITSWLETKARDARRPMVRLAT